MKDFALGAFLLCAATPLVAREDAPAGAQEFVTKATAGGLAEVDLGMLAVKNASSEAVRKFAQQMVDDHTKANKELLKLADELKLKAAATRDAEHDAVAKKLLTLKGAEFDREYVAGQVKDHEAMIALFEKQSKAGDDKLSAWAKKTLPDLKHHLEMAKKLQDKDKKDK